MFPATYTRKALDFVFSMNELKVIPALPWIRDFREKTRVEKAEEPGLLPVNRESLIQQKTYHRRERDTLLDPGYSRWWLAWEVMRKDSNQWKESEPEMC